MHKRKRSTTGRKEVEEKNSNRVSPAQHRRYDNITIDTKSEPLTLRLVLDIMIVLENNTLMKK
jgi:hypothetical protein